MRTSPPSLRRKGNSRMVHASRFITQKLPDVRMLYLVSTVILLAAQLPTGVCTCGIGFALAFTTTTATTKPSIRPLQTRSTTQREVSNIKSQNEDTKLWTLEQLEEYASDESVNVVISFTTFGPVYRAVARAKHDESIILGYVEGFLRPTQPKILHLDKMEIFQPVLERVRRQKPNTLQFGGINIGLGLLMGYRCLLYAAEPSQGPRTIAEFLAIDDEEFQHKRLVRYYRYAGFKIVKYVGDEPRDIPDRLVWGGCGTLMKQDIPTLMAKWTSLFKLMKSRVEKEAKSKNSTSGESDNNDVKQ